MSYETHAAIIRTLAARFAGEAFDGDCPIAWERAAHHYAQAGISEREMDTARRVLGDQVCGEIYRRELTRGAALSPAPIVDLDHMSDRPPTVAP